MFKEVRRRKERTKERLRVVCRKHHPFTQRSLTWSVVRYRCEPSSLAGFIQQLAVSYLANGYVFYVCDRIPDGKDAATIVSVVSPTDLKVRPIVLEPFDTSLRHLGILEAEEPQSL